jgi:Cu(I)/Ag(I) efflux system membrane protein CusA/SilA
MNGPSLWERLLGWFVDAKLVLVVLLGMLVFAGLRAAPFEVPGFEWLPRDPVPVDAIPDVGDNQQIVFTEWPGRSPRDVEDQVTYPLTTALLGIPGVRTVRSTSELGFSSIYVIFEDDVELYWSRSRILEKLAALPPGLLPEGVAPSLGPDATAVGQVFWYTLEGRDPQGRAVGGWDLHELRSIQDWTVRYALQSVSGVSEVSSIGGQVQEYQIDVDPDALRAQGVTLMEVAAAVRASNLDVGARTMEINGVEYLVRGIGFVRSIEDLEQAVVTTRDHTPIRVRDVAHVHLGPAERRGGLDDEGADVVGGVAVARFRENPLAVIEGLRAKIAEIAPGLRRTLEDGTVSQVTIVPFYDRAELVHETIDTLTDALYLEILITILVVLVMLRDLRSSFVISSVLPLGVLLALIVMRHAGVDANIMALGGIAIAIGTMVDMGIVLTENVVQHLERAAPGEDRAISVRRAVAEVAPAIMTSTLTTVVSFLPVLGLTANEARLFTPLALTKTFAMVGSLALALFVLPALAHLVLPGRGPRAARPRGLRAILGTLARPTHLFDLLLLVGGALLSRTHLAAGLVVALLGLSRIARPLVRDEVATWMERAENALAVVGVTLALSDAWMPFGPDRGALINTVFVGALVLGLLGGFRVFELFYGRLLAFFLRHKIAFLTVPAALVVFGLLVWRGFDSMFGWLPQSVRTSAPVSRLAHALPGLGREYMPPFDEGAYLYMPTTMAHASIGEVQAMMANMDQAIARIPEVDRVVGKWGRAESALDPAPISMVETIITYRPEYRIEPDGTRVRQWRDHIRSPADIWDEIVAAAEHPGMTSAPMLMPIATRIVMLQSGMRAPMGIKVQGPSLESIEAFGLRLEELLRDVPQIRGETVFADRVVGKPYLEVEIDREAIARYGLSIEAVQEVLSIALGGMPLTRTVEGRARYPVRVRYMREERDSVEALERLMVPTSTDEHVPLSELARLRYVRGPQMIRSEDTFLTSYVLFDRRPDVAEVDAVEAAQRYLESQIASGALEVPPGVSYRFAGTYEAQLRSEERLLVLVPLALALVFLLLYLQFRRTSTTIVIFTGVAVAGSGAFLLLWLYAQPWFLDFEIAGLSMRTLFQVGTVNLSMAVWVGVIALIGIATDDGVVIATYLKQRFEESEVRDVEDVRRRVVEAGLRRVRPCLMTTATTILALFPVVTSQGRGSDVMVPMALPAVGGMTIELMTLFVVPVLYSLLEELRVRRRASPTLAPAMAAAPDDAATESRPSDQAAELPPTNDPPTTSGDDET